MKKNNMAILVIGFDGYSDLWQAFFELLKKYWSDCPYNLYMCNNSLKFEVEGVKIINAGNEAEWSRKVKVALEHIKEDYICLLLEDFFVGDFVNTVEIEKTLKFIRSENIKYYKLNTFTPFKTAHYKGYSFLHTIPGNMLYGISLLPGIWERKFLEEKLGIENYNAWKFEYNRLEEERHSSKMPMEGCVFDSRNLLQIQHGVVQGKYLPDVVRYFEKRGYNLNQNVRGTMSFSEDLIYKCKRMSWPKPVRNILKNIMKLFGMKFVSDMNA